MAVNPNTRRGRDIAKFGAEHVAARDRASRARTHERDLRIAIERDARMRDVRALLREERKQQRREREQNAGYRDRTIQRLAQRAWAQNVTERGEVWAMQQGGYDAYLARVRRGGNVQIETEPGVWRTVNPRRIVNASITEDNRYSPGSNYEKVVTALGGRAGGDIPNQYPKNYGFPFRPLEVNTDGAIIRE